MSRAHSPNDTNQVSALPTALKSRMLDHLTALPSSVLPGVDGFTVDHVLGMYGQFAAEGLLPPLDSLLEE